MVFHVRAIHLLRSQGVRFASSAKMPIQTFFDITIGGKPAGRIVMEVNLRSFSYIYKIIR